MNVVGMEHSLSQLADVYLPPWRLFHLDSTSEAGRLLALLPPYRLVRGLSACLAIHLCIEPDWWRTAHNDVQQLQIPRDWTCEVSESCHTTWREGWSTTWLKCYTACIL